MDCHSVTINDVSLCSKFCSLHRRKVDHSITINPSSVEGRGAPEQNFLISPEGLVIFSFPWKHSDTIKLEVWRIWVCANCSFSMPLIIYWLELVSQRKGQVFLVFQLPDMVQSQILHGEPLDKWSWLVTQTLPNCRTRLSFIKYAHEHVFSVSWVLEAILRNLEYIYSATIRRPDFLNERCDVFFISCFMSVILRFGI